MPEGKEKKPGWQLLVDAANAVRELPELGSGELLQYPKRKDRITMLDLQCVARMDEIIPNEHAPAVIEALVSATVKTNISLTVRPAEFLYDQSDVGAITGCLASMGFTDWTVGCCDEHKLIHLHQHPDGARKRVADELTAIFRAKNLPDDVACAEAERIAASIVREGQLPIELFIELIPCLDVSAGHALLDLLSRRHDAGWPHGLH
jgi:hypothetical protein